MRFKELKQHIPFVVGLELYTTRLPLNDGVEIALPGRHQSQTLPVGGDFCVFITDPALDWTMHPFTHRELFGDIEKKRDENPEQTEALFDAYEAILLGSDPEEYYGHIGTWTNSLASETFLRAVQALAVAEHRRYSRFESRGGGKWLPLRYSRGIVSGHWTAKEASSVQKKGRPGVERLEDAAGIRWTTPIKRS